MSVLQKTTLVHYSHVAISVTILNTHTHTHRENFWVSVSNRHIPLGYVLFFNDPNWQVGLGRGWGRGAGAWGKKDTGIELWIQVYFHQQATFPSGVCCPQTGCLSIRVAHKLAVTLFLAVSLASYSFGRSGVQLADVCQLNAFHWFSVARTGGKGENPEEKKARWKCRWC